jgi:hypothetical protein
MNLVTIEHIIAIVGGIIVGVVAFHTLHPEWKAQGVENQVFKIMLFLLGVGAVIALLAGVGVLGNFPKGS